ncbi:EpsG family protein [Parvibacter caecicola]|uniref:EpsG family protein n=1 Tax=Parvibacter caecicola TaxID=747645 RepID=A0A7W5D1K5_9ACTN|nr:EpsG family protein [Parvibacter caecicola]MBB3171214.1 hypothetical protein [Parvibacter caecicola]MCR2041995.1 EpsG family protein [Parvibacter caecicola]RNL11385.1 hypothetical protein DMP11_03175 [Parvibacter caecicola]
MFLYVALAGLVAVVACFGLLDDVWHNRLQQGSRQDPRTYKIVTGVLVAIALLVAWWFTAERAINIGNDTANYVELFLSFREGIQPGRRYEIGFQVYCFLVGTITDDPHVFLEITASIMYVLLAIYIFRYSDNYPLSLCLAFCFAFSVFTNELRQGFALLVILFAYQQLKQNRKVCFSLLVFLAATFHLTALICFALLFKQLAPKRVMVVFVLGAVICLLCMTGVFSAAIGPFLGDYYSRYLTNSYASSGWLATSYYVLRAGVLCLLVYACTKDLPGKDSYRDLVRWDFCLLVFVSALGFSMNLFSRVAQYFLFVSISELPNLICRSSLRNRKAVCALIGVAFILFFLVVLWLRPEWNHLYPYQSWI